jgi:small subunit ribosomal protein S1
MSWARHVKHPSKVLSIHDEVEAMVLKVDQENEKISLGLKQVQPDPWEAIEGKYPEGSLVEGRVRNLTNFGAFVELEEGVDGLVHISDMSWTKRIEHPNEVVKKNDSVNVKVLNIDREQRRISLGLKQAEDDPWPTLTERYQEDSTISGKVVRLLDRGAVLELEEGVEGFVPVGQLGVEGLKRPEDAFKEGDELTVKVTRVDVANRRIVLSVRAYLDEQDDEVLREYQAKYEGAVAAAAAAEAAGGGADADADVSEESDEGAEDDGDEAATDDEETV